MKSKKLNVGGFAFVGAVLVAVVVVITGCSGETDKSQFNRTFFPTNHWRVVGQGWTNGEVLVETTSTNLLVHLRVHKATPIGRLTNGQPVRVEITTRWMPKKGMIEIISSKAYPAVE